MNIQEKLLSFLGEEAIVGIDIDQDCVRVASVSLKDNGKVALNQLGSLEYELGSSDQTISSSIKKLWRTQQIKTRTVHACLRSSSLISKYFNYPELAEQEVELALLLEAEQVFQKPPEDLFIDWHLHNSSDKAHNKESSQAEGILVAALAKDVNRQLSILEMADLYPVALDVGCMAVANLFIALNSRLKSENVCLLDIGSNSADITILSEDSHIYPSTIHSKSAVWGDNIDYLISYIIDVLRYHQFKLHKKPVREVILTGILSTDTKFQKKLKKAIGLPLETWDPLESSNLELNGVLDKKQINGAAMSVCLGLALRRE
ncbi:type IV pilus biogenesis protein PilM [Candidatus Omnitrophota bacterium]